MRPGEGSGALVLRGSALMALGLVISGVGTLVMVAIASRGLPPSQFAVFTTWWLTATILAPMMGVFEVYLARAILARSSTGLPEEEAISQLFGLSLVAVGVVASLTVLAAPVLADRVFGGDLWAPLTIPVFVAVVALQSIQRGVASGRRAFGVIGLQLSLDGVLRALLAGLVIWGGAGSLVFITPILAGLVSVAAVSPRLQGWMHPPRPRHRAVEVSPIGWLLVAAGGPVLIGNAVAPWFAAAAVSDVAVVAGFSAALLVSRVPTQLASAAFAPVMAQMARLVDRGDVHGLGRTRRKALVWAALIGAAFTTAYMVLGQWALSLYVGPGYEVPRWTLGLLAGASALLFLATIQQAALTAQNRWGTIAVAWVSGTVAFGATLLLPVSPIVRASLAPFVGVLVAAIAMEALPLARHRVRGPGSGPMDG